MNLMHPHDAEPLDGVVGTDDHPSDTSPRPRSRRWAWGLGVTAAIGAPTLFFTLSPWPGTRIIRWIFNRDSAKVTAALERHAPDGVDSITDEAYRADDPQARLDVYFPAAAEGALPTVIWTHGGAWISGRKSDFSGYYRLLASRGYTVVSLDYSLGPEATYPTAVRQLNEAHAHLLAHAERLRVEPGSIVLAGDSAGAQLTSQLATAITRPAYADELGIVPSLKANQLAGVILNCGIYDLNALSSAPGVIGWGIEESLWAYTGVRDVARSDAAAQMSTLNHVTGDFPATFISGGNGDPLTDVQSKPLAKRLTELGVDVDTLFFPASHRPKLGHEYQFDLDVDDGKLAFERTVDFVAAHTT